MANVEIIKKLSNIKLRCSSFLNCIKVKIKIIVLARTAIIDAKKK